MYTTVVRTSIATTDSNLLNKKIVAQSRLVCRMAKGLLMKLRIEQIRPFHIDHQNVLYRIDDYAKDGGEELFTKMHCVL